MCWKTLKIGEPGKAKSGVMHMRGVPDNQFLDFCWFWYYFLISEEVFLSWTEVKLKQSCPPPHLITPPRSATGFFVHVAEVVSPRSSGFSLEDDLPLLCCVGGYDEGNPFDYGSGSWKEISALLNGSDECSMKSCSGRNVRDRNGKLVTKHWANNNWRRRQEQYDEKEKLMDKAASLLENKACQADLPRSRERREEVADKDQGAATRDLAMTTLASKRAAGKQKEAKKRAVASSTIASGSSCSNSGALLEFFLLIQSLGKTFGWLRSPAMVCPWSSAQMHPSH